MDKSEVRQRRRVVKTCECGNSIYKARRYYCAECSRERSRESRAKAVREGRGPQPSTVSAEALENPGYVIWDPKARRLVNPRDFHLGIGNPS